MSKFIDLTGQIFGYWSVIGPAGQNKHKHYIWLCRCRCGAEKTLSTCDLRRGHSKSCGCLRMGILGDLTGQIFGRLTVVSIIDGTCRAGKIKWFCKCSCGNEKIVAQYNLVNGNTQSCGCIKKELQHRLGVNHPNWGGGRYKDSRGYIRVYKPDHPNAYNHKYILEHILVMSEFLGRPLEGGETVHHKNGIRDQNNIENLELWSTDHSSGQRVSDLIVWAKQLLIKYGSLTIE